MSDRQIEHVACWCIVFSKKTGGYGHDPFVVLRSQEACSPIVETKETAVPKENASSYLFRLCSK